LRDDDPAGNPSSNDFSTLIQTPLSQVLRFHATRGAGRTYTSPTEDLFQRQPFDGAVGAGLSFEELRDAGKLDRCQRGRDLRGGDQAAGLGARGMPRLQFIT